MKELHNHIFSNTTCISKETMLRYINKQLSKKELYEVEKHMLDCELCTDAFEGMKMATNSSVLFAIDSKIDLRTRGGVNKSPIMRNLMVAASVMIVAFGAYFTINNFNENLDKSELAVNEVVEEKSIQPAPENFITEGIIDEENKQEVTPIVLSAEAEDLTETNNSEQQKPIIENDRREELIIVNDAEVEIAADIMSVDAYSMDFDEVESVEEERGAEEIMLTDNVATNAKTLNNRNDNTMDVSGNTALSNTDGTISKSAKQAAGKNENKKKDKSKRAKKFSASFAEPEMNMDANVVTKQNTYDIYSYKVYDYATEYQNDYDFKKSAELQTIAPDFSNEEDKGLAEKELEKTTVEITYKATLEKGVKHLKDQQYQMAINQFSLILKTHPKDINALFYAGISKYHLKQFEASKAKFEQVIKHDKSMFNQEAKWYKALSLIGLNETVNAKVVLQEIIDANGFYKGQAIKKVGELK